ncbi:MAG: hypothetical protein UX03_C0008G0005 [Candidatus Woesebacteria bacterium GW2011_GWE1_45_18]|uniref:DUF3048 domain-containing protein n=7 Tax=Candidatus Woeseibacteriota TaxID=1752722 RepID=A0A1F8D6N0_9BACT|nr:MAG: hypothetical protein UX03_C0008G0005 [Candidatus Woesebacteria bacterium GW2011_GWE1_45_18]KKU22955.1 MAG: hypothetical protein UX34_C0018G0003 [Candidatus Woesebacteria bacterium GW2011_GWF1_46_13]OGM79473.1 MAG: hypothetical protein A2197_00665 [Candidatus Woesebacteria bacterium RIFOXYA1_FULL_48_16]OGM84247.1 MAG: hypothetical protein A2376_01355 [Candidatus Woesebacteria bacterium RIFOXYB1_FULL_47_31]OGM86275.1 MAG: hypothetical protein A2435_02945 [Candidatus Woesebacteria bacteriu
MNSFFSKAKVFLSTRSATIALSFLGLYLLSSGVSLAIFSFVRKDEAASADIKTGRSRINLDLPKTEDCPLNGGMFTKVEGEIWEARRPVTAMIENHADSRPSSGLSKADVIYEIVAEGGITRFLAVYYCNTAAEEVKIAPVRSARIYFIDYAAEYGDKPIFMHVGGANDFSGSGDTVRDVRALEILEQMGWRTPRGNDFDTTYDSGFPVFWRNYERLDHPVATEHTMMASLDAAYEEAARRGLGAKDKKGVAWDKNFVSWKFIDDKPQTPSATDISFGFWDNKSDYDVNWQYDAANNRYLRFNAGVEQIDLEFKQPLFAKNVVILFAKERGPVDRNGHMFYTTVGTGKVLVFQNGSVVEGTWEKDSRQERTKFLDEDGKEISFVRGIIWIEVVPAGNNVSY